MIKRLVLYIKWYYLRLWKPEGLFLNKYVDVIPPVLHPYILYVENDKQPYFASLLCPCGCEDVINLNLDKHDRPHWVLDVGLKTNLNPSIWKSANCKSHFFIRNGKIKWCTNDL